MNINKNIKITNSRGDSIEFGRHFLLLEEFQLSGLGARVNYSQTTQDGAYYQSSKLDVKDIDIVFYIKRDERDNWWIEEKRDEFYRVCNPKLNPMKIEFSTKANKKYFINVQCSSVPIFLTKRENDNKKFLKGMTQFIATDPFIYENEMQKVEIAEWIGGLEFPLEVVEDGIEIGYRAPSLIVNVENRGSEATGIIIEFKALSTVTNPKLININTYEEMKILTEMQGGDRIIVSTFEGDRYVKLVRNNITTSIFNKFDFLNSTFLQIYPGDNLFRYDADVNLNSLEVSMEYRNKRIGV